MLIPHRELSAEALQGLIEDIVTREGTDYGESETALAEKVAQVKRQLGRGLLVITYDDQNGTVSIVSKDQVPSVLE